MNGDDVMVSCERHHNSSFWSVLFAKQHVHENIKIDPSEPFCPSLWLLRLD